MRSIFIRFVIVSGVTMSRVIVSGVTMSSVTRQNLSYGCSIKIGKLFRSLIDRLDNLIDRSLSKVHAGSDRYNKNCSVVYCDKK